ncbi:MAG: bifunctional folylpolyglutamate synthase/dihydrofolate synthase [Lachnospiraceae bacterium]|jgi:dihydrofolate synthase/folylpolyglutamate synthase|nr:bifunctional folylpolyglutamate synthase/dihydrofolate synthase [Lachnospiraceae bacterium]
MEKEALNDNINDINIAYSYIEELPKFTMKHPLNHTRDFLVSLNNPGLHRKFIHVAGTNGKGSVCVYTEAMLLAIGKSVGTFISPHLIDMRERIRINAEMVPEEAFLNAFNKAKNAAVRFEGAGLGHPSYFEFLFAIAMSIFGESNVEYIILETGLGGRLDATNIIDAPIMTIITSIGLDHMQYLGETIEEIAHEKAGILRAGTPLVMDGTIKRASEVIKKEAKEKGIDADVVTHGDVKVIPGNINSIAFSRQMEYHQGEPWHLQNMGKYEIINAEIAIRAMTRLFSPYEKYRVAWKKALANVMFPGRMQSLGERIIIDGAHNIPAINAFITSFEYIYKSPKDSVIVFSAVYDKKADEMARLLCERIDVKEYIVTQLSGPRGIKVNELAKMFRKYTNKKVTETKDVNEAFDIAVKRRDEGATVFILGSLYLAGEVLKIPIEKLSK